MEAIAFTITQILQFRKTWNLSKALRNITQISTTPGDVAFEGAEMLFSEIVNKTPVGDQSWLGSGGTDT